MPEWDDIDLTKGERQLEAELMDLGPLMREARRARAEDPDPAFLTALRTRLVEPQPVAPDRTFQRQLRRRLVGGPLHWRWPLGLGVGAIAAAALVLLFLLHPLGRAPESRRLAIGIPLATKQDLTRSYPPLGVAGGGGGYLVPTRSLTQGLPGEAYPGRLHLTAGSFPPTPSSEPIYRLASQPLRGASLADVAHRLGIESSPICMDPITARPATCNRGTWSVVAVHLFPSRQPLHSIAVSPQGEVVYHDAAYQQATYHGPSLSPRRATVIARAWLAGLGWPASRMPILGVAPTEKGVVNAAVPLAVSFGWDVQIHSTSPQATLWIAPTGRVTEADLWPPIVHRGTVAAQDVGAAWSEVASGKAQVAIMGGVLYPLAAGTGTASTVEIVEVLVTPAHGPSYLEPAFRFSGTVALNHAQGTHAWYALVSAVARP